MKRKSISSLSEESGYSSNDNLSDTEILGGFFSAINISFTGKAPSIKIEPKPVYIQTAQCVDGEKKVIS